MLKKDGKREYDKAMSDYSKCRSDINKAHALIGNLTSELQRVREEKEALEKQVHDYLTAESYMR